MNAPSRLAARLSPFAFYSWLLGSELPDVDAVIAAASSLSR